MVTTKFTDNNLKTFYSNLLRHYAECVARSPKPDHIAIYNELFFATQYLVEYPGDVRNPSGQFYHLEPGEKIKVYQAFNALFYALPSYRELPLADQYRFNPQRPLFKIESYRFARCSHYHSHYGSFFTDWLIFNSLINPRYNYYRGSVFNPGPIHTHPGKNSEETNKILLGLLVLAVTAIVATLAIVAFAYMLYDLSDSLERLWYNEGWLKAALSISLSLAVGSISTGMMVGFAVEPLVAIALAAGLNPAFLVIFAIVSVGMLGAGLACLGTSLTYDYLAPNYNQDAIDPTDPQRFALTAEEEIALIHKKLDPIKVKCAIVSLRASIAQVASSETVPSFFSRKFGDSGNVQELLQKVRQLRRGELVEVKVGDLFFDCSIPPIAPPSVPYPENNNVTPPTYHPNDDIAPPPYPSDYELYLQNHVLPEGYLVPPTAPPLVVDEVDRALYSRVG